jgi:cytochrome c-type biogenesis protein
MSVASLVSSGPLLLALPVAAAAGAVTFLSPCCLPLVPGYLAYITGMSGADSDGEQAAAPPARLARPHRGRMVAGTALFVLGFSLVFSLLGLSVGGIGHLLQSHSAGITRILGGATVLPGWCSASAGPPCIGPTLAAVQALSFSTGTAARGAFLALIYGLGLGLPFLIVAALFERTANLLVFFKNNARLVTRVGGLMLIALGLIEATGAWTAAIAWMHTHWYETYSPQL